MIDLLIMHPGISQNQLAAAFGYSPSWTSTVMNSDAFRMRLAQRREEVVDPAVKATIREKFDAIIAASQEKLLEKLSLPAAQIPDNLLIRAAELGAKANGLGGHAPAGGVNVNIGGAPGADRLELLSNRLIALQSRIQGDRDVLEVETREVAQASQAPSDEGLSRQGSLFDEPAEGTVRAFGGGAGQAALQDGGGSVDCGRCGRAVPYCQCDNEGVD
jgi:hypothetical protein